MMTAIRTSSFQVLGQVKTQEAGNLSKMPGPAAQMRTVLASSGITPSSRTPFRCNQKINSTRFHTVEKQYVAYQQDFGFILYEGARF
jgi:hypothetical protein